MVAAVALVVGDGDGWWPVVVVDDGSVCWWRLMVVVGQHMYKGGT
jgi:hypothetical protein